MNNCFKNMFKKAGRGNLWIPDIHRLGMKGLVVFAIMAAALAVLPASGAEAA